MSQLKTSTSPQRDGSGRDEPAPLSFAQQRLWFLEQLTPGGTAYTMPYALRLTGPLDPEKLRAAFTDIVARHETQRTSFVTIGEEPRQVVLPAAPFDLPLIDLAGVADQAAALRRLAAEDNFRPFDLESGTMLRARLVRLTEREHVLLITQHHIASDGWSRALLLRDLGALYAAHVDGTDSPLAPLPLKYTDFARSLQDWRQSPDFDHQRSYWHAQLEGLQSLVLPADRTRPAALSPAAGRVEIALSPADVERIQSVSRAAGASMFMTILAAFKAVLWRQTGQDDLAIGIAVANRTRLDLEPLIGLITNTLVLRTDLSGAPTFRELVARERHVALGAYEHQGFPFEQLVADLHPTRDVARNPLFEVLVNKVEVKPEDVPFGPLRAAHEDCFEDQARFDLTLYVWPHGSHPCVRAVYSRDLFDHGRIAELLDQFALFMRSATSDPDRPISEYSLVTDRGRRLLPDPTAALPAADVGDPVTVVVERQAAQYGDREAVRWRARSWSYRELSRAVHAIADDLVAQGVKPGDVVALEGSRSFGLVAGMLGIMASGGVALPLDARMPAARRESMVRQARATRLLTVGDASCDLDPWTGLPRRTPVAPSADLPRLGPEDSAYIFFTSGSAGSPKGILGKHGGLSHFIAWQRETFRIGPDDRVAQFSTWSFDVLLRDVFLPLTSGATLCVPDDDDAAWSPNVLEWLERERVSAIHVVPSVVRRWIETAGVRRPLPALRWTFFAGEPLPATLITRWRAVAPATEVANLYGPTETCMVKCWYVAPANPRDGVQPIGQSLPGSQALVLNARGVPCGIGEPGEIVIRTAFGTKGYLEPAAADRDRFRANPFHDDPTDLVYATGDIGRYRHDGVLEILGRVDDQVKVSGVRIEPREIEAVLESHPAVASAAVVAKPDSDGQPLLVAYVVAAIAEPEPLRVHLAARIPTAMMPRAWVFLASMPLTPSGKVNRAALPDPEPFRPAALTPAAEPRRPEERALAGIWAEVLRLERVGIHDNFFDLGGHSLLAAQVMMRLRRTLGIELPVRAIFEAPTIAALADRIATAKDPSEPPAPEPDGSPSGRPLSFAQQRMWLLDQLEPGGAGYNLPRAFNLDGPLNVEALEAALSEIVRRHATLRTTFITIGHEPRQVIHPSAPVDLTIIDLRSSADRDADVRRYVDDEAVRPFDLSRDLMLRATLLRLAADRHVLLLTVHHIAADGWSLGVLQGELGALYAAALDTRPVSLPPLAAQYTDFADWQHSFLQGAALAGQRAYWHARMRGLQRTELATDRPRRQQPPSLCSQVTFTVPADVSERLRRLARTEQATLFMALLGAFQALLSRYCDQEDVSVAIPIANRSRPEFEPLIGLLVNTLVMRTDLSGDPTFRDVLRRVREMALGAFEHQDFPFEQLVADLQPDRDLGRNPFVQLLFALQNAPAAPLELRHLTVSSLPVVRRRTGFDIECHILPGSDGGLSGLIAFSDELFDRATIERLVNHFQAVLSACSLDPDLQVSNVPLLSDAERRTILADWNDTAAEYPRDRCLHELFEAQVARTPDAIAVVAGSERITYRDLERRAARIAAVLRGLGVGPDEPVGLSVERNVNLIAAVLGILKAGGAYVPLDPEHPPARLRFVQEDAGVKVVVTERSLASAVEGNGRIVVCLDEPMGETADVAASAAAPGTLAYVMYTSGSTGQPKGVAIEHRSVVNLLAGARALLGVDGRDVVLSASSFAFDISVAEFFLPLTAGGVLVLVSRDVARDAGQLLAALRETKPTVFLSTPSMWRVLCGLGWTPDWSITCISTGEALPADLAEDLASRCPTVWNLYGPTEATIWATGGRVRPGESDGSIGRPLANMSAFVLDRHRQPVPVGVHGELYLGGDGLARGYLNRPQLSAENFVSHALAPAGRLYRTGDRVKWRTDGTLQFFGRRDGQVKIRGHRIEVQEIETVLARHPAIQACAVTTWGDSADDLRLVAYCVPAGGATLATRDLAGHLRTLLPEYMVPAQFVTLPELPVTPNGKVDRIALPAPGPDSAPDASAFVAPRTGIERTLADIWTTLLGVPRVGLDDNFFDLGGHSLLAARMLIHVRQALGVEIRLRALFETPTVGQLAARIEARTPADAAVAPMQHADRSAPGRPEPLSFAQRRMWFLQELNPDSSAYHIVRAFEIAGPLNRPALEAALAAIVRRHGALRTRFSVIDGEPRQIVREDVALTLEHSDLRGWADPDRAGEAARRIEAEGTRPFDLSQDVLIRARLLQLADERHLFVYTLHHIAGDGVSLDVLATELAELYEAGVHGRPPLLPDLPLQYADFARWQNRQLQSSAFAQALDFWRRQLRDVPVLELPTDHVRPLRMTHRGGNCRFAIPTDVVEQLRYLARAEGATLFMTLLAAFNILLARHSRQRDFGVGVPVTNRPRREFEPLIGFFANTLGLRANLSGDPTFRESIARVREAALDAFDHQDLPFEQIVAELAPARDTGRSPLVQVVFSFDTADEPLRLSGLAVSRLGSAVPRARFDLELFVREDPDGSLHGSFTYATDLFEDATIVRLADQWNTLLRAIIVSPDQSVWRLDLLPPDERQRLLSFGMDTDVDYPRDRSLGALFDAQAARTPEAVAVVHGQTSVTYRALGERADVVARRLRTLGVGPDVPVGLCLDRGIDLIVGTLAIVKAGGAYVPLDPGDPSPRLHLMIADAQAPVIVTHSTFRERFEGIGATLVCIDSDIGQDAVAGGDTALPSIGGDHLAYVMYTSGSTGRPKGAMIPHRAVARLVLNTNYLQLGPADTIAQVSNAAFDAATLEIWGALLNGARLVILDRETVIGRDFGTALRDHGVTALFLTTALFNHLAAETPAALASVRHVLIGGDRADAAAIRRVQAAGKPARLLNCYGPTESTTFATWHEIEEVGTAESTVPIGRPIANSTVCVLDEALQLVPIGVPGELCIGGDGLARGYIGQPDLTAERFVPHPFAAGGRLYRTGDLARWRPDGRLDFLGRQDLQLKVRGYRIELGEIEAVLATHELVSACVVTAIEPPGGEKRLVAHVVLQPGRSVGSRTLQHFLRNRLPEYMTPATIVFVPALPLTSNGKIDRQALTADANKPAASASASSASAEPLSDTETRLLRVWRDVLGVADIGPDDWFFNVGGHSLLAIRLFSRIEAEFGVRLPLSQLFVQGTVAALARALDDSRHVEPWTPLVPIRPTGSGAPLFLVHGIGGEVLTFTNLALRLPPDVPVYGIQAAGPGSDQAMVVDIEELASRYVSVVTSVDPVGPYYLGGYSSGAVIALEIAHQLEAQGRPVALVLALDGGVPRSQAARIRHSPASLLRQVGYWIVDDAMATSAQEWWPRARSVVRKLTRSIRFPRGAESANGRGRGDVRDDLGMWRFPDSYRALLQARYDAFLRYMPKPVSGRIALIRSRTGQLLGPHPGNLDAAWRALAAGPFTLAYIRGSHGNILMEPRVAELARTVADLLRDVRGANGQTSSGR
jgi:amino acid adenylation domain-containing protein